MAADEPSKQELLNEIEELREQQEEQQQTLQRMLPDRRQALKGLGLLGAGGLFGAASSGGAAGATGDAGQVGDSSNRPDIFGDDANLFSVTDASSGNTYDIDDLTSGGGGSASGFGDGLPLALGPAGSGYNDLDRAVGVPNNQTVELDSVYLKLKGGTTDSDVRVRLLDHNGTVQGAVQLDSDPKIDQNPGIFWENTTGADQGVVIQLVNLGSNTYIPHSSGPDGVMSGVQWSVN